MGSTVKAGYWPAYAYSYSPPSALDASLFTHFFYAFADLNPQTFQVTVSADNQQSISHFTSTLQSRNPSVKTLLSIGGGVEGIETTFATMAADASRRNRFIQSSIALARQYSFHGVDLDWEYPQTVGDMQNWGRLFSEWRAAVNAESRSSGKPPLLLTAAVYFSQKFFAWGPVREYPIASVSQNLDWVNIMTYDFHGKWEPDRTGAHAALYDPLSNSSTSFGVQSWLNAGLSPNKIVVGMPIYGHSWKLQNQTQVGIGAPANGAGVPDYKDGLISYADIRNFIRNRGAREVYDATTVSAYCYSGFDWIGYDNQQSVGVKVEFAKNQGLRGYFFWNVTQDSNSDLSTKASQTWSK